MNPYDVDSHFYPLMPEQPGGEDTEQFFIPIDCDMTPARANNKIDQMTPPNSRDESRDNPDNRERTPESIERELIAMAMSQMGSEKRPATVMYSNFLTAVDENSDMAIDYRINRFRNAQNVGRGLNKYLRAGATNDDREFAKKILDYEIAGYIIDFMDRIACNQAGLVSVWENPLAEQS
jgi:hypothetical protein